MSPIFYIFLAALVIAQIALPSRFAFLPIIIATLHFGNYEYINNVTPIRTIVLIGLLRASFSGSFAFNLRNKMDSTMALFALYILFSSFFHNSNNGNPLYMRIGLNLDIIGTYVYCRSFVKSKTEFTIFVKCTAIAIAPLAATMFVEFLTQINPYAALGARHEAAGARFDKVRAAGPFAHAILAGTAGAAMTAFFWALRKESKRLFLIGFPSALLIVFTSSSSGPVATTAAAAGCMYLVKYRDRLKQIKVIGVIAIVLASIGMGKAPWHLMAKIDIVGGSTGWHRARLMDRGWQYLNEWWFAGTDYTRHWMASGVAWSKDHVDMTNYYLHIGVIAGLPAVLLLIRAIFIAFSHISELLKSEEAGSKEYLFIWAMGATLFAHCVTFVSVSYFDQISTLFYLLLAGVTSSYLTMRNEQSEQPSESNQLLNRNSMPT